MQFSFLFPPFDYAYGNLSFDPTNQLQRDGVVLRQASPAMAHPMMNSYKSNPYMHARAQLV